ncbi:MAG: TonB-dependent receptor [Fluviicola sp.]
MKKTLQLLTLLFLPTLLFGQNQTIKGTITDKQSTEPLYGARVVIVGTDPLVGAIADLNGQYRLENLNPGRYELSFTMDGYRSQTAANVIVSAGKETVIDIQLEESINTVEDVVILAKKGEMNNENTSVSSRSFSMEEVNRYAGGRSDPARLAANFAGVSSPDDSRNDLVIRGNSPIGVLWRLEGLNIGNPNHFATIGTTGGPVSAINTNLLRNSDFMTSAFPSEYGNANAGVFDLGFRSGNSDKREHTFQFGAITGLEFVTEGPIRKDKGSSYLVGYRYGFPSMAQKLGLQIGTAATPYYQDLSFKVVSGNTKLGKFTFFGIGAVSSIDFLHDKIDSADLFADPSKDSYFTSQIATAGIKHSIRVSDKSYVLTVIGGNYSGSNYLQDSIGVDKTPARTIENTTSRLTMTLNSSYNSKLSARHFLKLGVIAEQMNIDLYYRNREETPVWVEYWNTKEQTYLLQTYAHYKYSFSNNLTLNSGLHAQVLTLNNAVALEPRLGVKWQLAKTGSLSFGYGLHSQMQPLDIYFLQSYYALGNKELLNKELGFTKSHHLVAGYEWLPNAHWRVKTEVYYQYLFQIPVERTSSSYSMINAGASFFPNDETNLVNEGTGENYGLELTVERYFHKGFYGLLSGSIYEAKYTASDNIERNTAFNGRYVYNVLVGKEVKVGKAKRNTISLDVKFTHAGGRFYTPVDLVLSQLAGTQINKGDAYAYSEQYADFLRLDVKVGFTLNSAKRSISQSWFFDVNNVTNRKNIFADRYNPLTNSINTAYQIGFFPNFVYRIEF